MLASGLLAFLVARACRARLVQKPTAKTTCSATSQLAARHLPMRTCDSALWRPGRKRPWRQLTSREAELSAYEGWISAEADPHAYCLFRRIESQGIHVTKLAL